MTGSAASSLPPLLAFDTSTEVLAIAAAGPRGSVAVNLPGGATASTQLVPQIGAVLERVGLGYHDLGAIAFGRGPGAFTGLRTSCAVAQGLGFALDKPLLPLDSLLVVAEDALGTAAMSAATSAAAAHEPGAAPARTSVLTPRIAVAMDARMDEIYGAVYEFDGEPGAAKQIMASPMGSQEGVAANAHSGGWRMARAPALYALSAWNAVLEGEGAALHGVAGSALEAFGARMPVAAGARTWPRERDRAAALLRLAARAWADGAAVDAAQALPIYLRDKVALTTAERAAARSAAGQPPRGGAQARR